MSLSTSPLTRLWLYMLIAIPLLPRVKALGTDDMPILLDDLAMALCVGLAIMGMLTRGAMRGFLSIYDTTTSVCFFTFIIYKAVAFLFLAMFLPWTSSVVYEKGIVIGEGFLVMAKLIFFFLVYNLVLMGLPERQDSLKAFNVMVWCMALVVFYGLVQFFILDHTALTSTFRNIYQMGLTKPGIWEYIDPWFGNATIGHEHFGAFLILTFSLLAGLLLCGYPRRQYRRYATGLLLFGCIFCLVYSSSRGAWIGTICSLALFFIWHLQQGKIVQLGSYGLYAVLGLVTLVYALDLEPIALISKRVDGLLTVMTGKVTDVSANDRLATMRVLWTRFEERPLIGWGAGGAGRIAEGQYIRELVEGGIIGGVLFAALLFSCISMAQKHRKRSSDPIVKGSNLGLICGIAGMAGQSVFTELFILTKVGIPFWVLVAIVQSLGFQEERAV